MKISPHIEKRLIERRLKREASKSSIIVSPCDCPRIDVLQSDFTKYDVHILNRLKKNVSDWRKYYLSMPFYNEKLTESFAFGLYCLRQNSQFALITNSGDHTAVGKIWNPSKLMPYLLCNQQLILSPLFKLSWFTGAATVVELGCGWAGSAGLAIGRCCSVGNVILTDGEAIMVQSLELNAIAEGGNVSAHLLRWGNEADCRSLLEQCCNSRVGLVVGCDVVYANPRSLSLTIADHLGAHRILLCWERRDHLIEEEHLLLELLKDRGYAVVLHIPDALLALTAITEPKVCDLDVTDMVCLSDHAIASDISVFNSSIESICREMRSCLHTVHSTLIILALEKKDNMKISCNNLENNIESKFDEH